MKNSMLKIINPILAVLLVNQALTGLLHDMMPDEAFEFVHEGGGIVLVIASILHVILNWNWIKSTYLRKSQAIKN